MTDPLPTVPYDLVYQALVAIKQRPGTLAEAAILEAFGMPQNNQEITTYNALGRRVSAFLHLYQYYQQRLKELGLTEYQMFCATAVAPLDYTADGWELDEFVGVASRLPANA